MTRFFPLLILLALCAACGPLPEAQAQTGAPAQGDGAAVEVALVQARATEAAVHFAQTAQAHTEAIERSAAATVQANADRVYAAQQAAQGTQGALDAARLRMEQAAAQQTQQAASTADHWNGLATAQSLSSTGTMAVMQAAAQGSIATATAGSNQATAMVIAARSSAEALLIPRQGQATAIALVAMPTEAARNAQAQRERLDGYWTTLGRACGTGVFVIVVVAVLLMVRGFKLWEHMIYMRTPAVRQFPAQPAAEQIPAAPALTTPQRFIAACIQAAGADATTLPGWRDLPGEFGNGSGWSGVVALLSGTPYLLIERGTDGRYHPVNGMTLREVYDLLPVNQ